MEGSETPTPEEKSSETQPPTLNPPRRPLLRKRNEPEPAPATNDPLAGAIALLSSLYTQAQEEGGATPGASATPPERTQSVLQAKRLSRSGSGGTSEDRVGTAEPGPRGEPGTPGGGAALGVMKPRVARSPRRRSWGDTLAWVVGIGVVLLVFGAGWYALREKPAAPARAEDARSASPAPNLPLNGGQVSDAALQIADQTLDAIGKGDLAAASALLEDADRRQIRLPGLHYQAALLAYRQHDTMKAVQWLDSAIELGEGVPECDYLLSAAAASANDYPTAANRMAEAARLTPFNPRYYFYWGECLRRAGKPAEAIQRFEHARLCRPSSGDLDLILFKLNLAKIEAGNDAAFQAELTEKLSHEPIAGNLLLLAAANEVSHSHDAAATPYLQRAAQVLPPAVMQVRLRDYIFRLPANENALVAEWAALVSARSTEPPPPSGKLTLVDPATRNLADSDPAVW